MRAAGPGEGQWRRRGPEGDGRESEARQAAMTVGPGECHVTMQAAMAVV